ncbi:hypothetical protein EUTSA_v10000924mg [Eutrema salsugineum]|uniref:NB-ARC domain-containing protein n=1 Tax=Eutrema salsugineum TaxID=72664 RepID=V4L7Q7_EUTSA|nr:probable disease resistance protein At5g45490 [Eutrema salsugineum]ESQ39674.1 hypothetical protein EUTSA_v10000924mg [Eutrema salsugineum]
MATENPKPVEPPVDKREFIIRFQEKYETWHQKLQKKKDTSEQEDPKTKMMEDDSSKQAESKTKMEDDRVETFSELPKHENKKNKEYVIHGFENEIKSLENFLLDQKVYKEFKSLVVLGEYGVGKTTLCQAIFNKYEVKSVYAPGIWVSMYSKEETKDGEDKKISLLKRILKDLGVQDKVLATIKNEAVQEFHDYKESGNNDGETKEDKEFLALLYALHLNLRWKKYLIVFDDVREEDLNQILQEQDVEKLKKDKKWGKHLSDGFPKGSGGRVIYTTRVETLARKLVAEEHEIHRLWPLSDDQSVWNIYEAVIEDHDKEPPRNDKKCIDDLMNKSRGLPLAAKLLAKLDPVFLDDEVGPNDSTDGTTETNQQDPPLTSG